MGGFDSFGEFSVILSTDFCLWTDFSAAAKCVGEFSIVLHAFVEFSFQPQTLNSYFSITYFEIVYRSSAFQLELKT